jgi:Fe-S-cluster containining protein
MSDQMQMPGTAPGRSCGDCSMCCKLPQIDELEKPEGVWCRHCAPRRGGCTIYPARPVACRMFHCSWLVDADLGPEWRPLTCKMIVVLEEAGRRLAVRVDPNHPDAWRRAPYYSQLKRWSRTAVEAGQQVIVHIRRRVIVILPDKDVDLGDVGLGEQIWVGAHDGPTGVIWDAARIPADVPPEHAGSWIASQTARKPAV